MAQNAQNGTIKFFNDQKGYGFIICEDNTDIFFHKKNVRNKEKLDPKGKDVRVTFDIEKCDKGNEARNVILL